MPAVELRLATPDDAPSVAEVYITAFRAAYEFPLAHDDESVRWWIRDVLLPGHETWVAVDGEQIVAFMALGAGAIEQIHVRPGGTAGGSAPRSWRLRKSGGHRD